MSTTAKITRALLEELAHNGSPVDMSVADDVHKLNLVEIEQVGGIYFSRLFELEDGRLGFMAGLAVTNHTASAMQVIDVELRSALIDDWFQWLTPVEVRLQVQGRREREFQIYRFPGACGLEIPYDEAINPALLESGMLQPKRRVEGWLVGVGGLMPAGLMRGQLLDLTLAIIGSDHAEYTKALRLWTERLETRPKFARKGSTLFEGARPRQVENFFERDPLSGQLPRIVSATSEADTTPGREERTENQLPG